MIREKNDSFNLNKKDIYYFNTKFATAIYGQNAKKGLFILSDK
jgi:hypothetical protein